MNLSMLSAATLLAAVLGAELGHAAAPLRREMRCPTGYLPREVRIEHQRLEAGLPRQGQVVTPNTWPEDNDGRLDRRYTVALVCVRPVTDLERNTEPYTDQP